VKNILLFVFLLSPIIGFSQDKNLITGWYSNQNSYMIEYSRNLGCDINYDQTYGLNVGIGYNFREDVTKISVGGHGILNISSKWNPILKMGIVLYDVESYDVFIGCCVQRNNLHLVTKLYLFNLATGNFNEGEWIGIGFGFSF